MREIKFRCWSKKHQMMWAWENNGEENFDFNKERLNPDSTLMQFTGLKDKNGKEIYEGDILKVKMGQDWQDRPMIVANTWDVHVWKNESDSYLRVTSMEVIGNIYENPKLLKRSRE